LSPWVKGLLVGVVQVGLVASLGAKLLYDRATLPRVWVRVAPYDPNLPIRGRYVRLQLVVEPQGLENYPKQDESALRNVVLRIENGRLVGEVQAPDRQYDPTAPHIRMIRSGGEKLVVLDTSVPFFIPEHVDDPSRRPAGEQLWVEATIPTEGPPRPIRLGVKKGDGPIVPMDLQ